MDKIKTTHVGSLPRSKKLSEILFKKDKNELFDQGELDQIIEEDVNKIVKKQIDITLIKKDLKLFKKAFSHAVLSLDEKQEEIDRLKNKN